MSLFNMRASVKAEDVFPANLLFLGIEPATDFERRGQGDDQLRDKDTGERVWQARFMDPHPDASKFGRSPAVTVKFATAQQPVPPSPQFPGVPPLVSLTGMTVTPYLNSDKCNPPQPGKAHRCRAQVAYSIWATGIVDAMAAASA